jgi:hypothetical protein
MLRLTGDMACLVQGLAAPVVMLSSVWYKWTAPASTAGLVVTFNTNFDAYVILFVDSASIASLKPLISYTPRLAVHGGAKIALVVDGRRDSGLLSWSSTPPVPADMFVDRRSISGASGSVVVPANGSLEYGEAERIPVWDPVRNRCDVCASVCFMRGKDCSTSA